MQLDAGAQTLGGRGEDGGSMCGHMAAIQGPLDPVQLRSLEIN